MSYQSVIAAATNLVQGAVPSLVSVIDARPLQQGSVPPNQCPAVLFIDRMDHEDPFTQESQLREWWLDTHLTAYYPDLDSSIDGFRSFQEQILAAYRSQPDLNGSAETEKTHVLLFGRKLQIQTHPWMTSGTGQIVRTGTIAALVHEQVYLS